MIVNKQQLVKYASSYHKVYGHTPSSDDAFEQAVALANLLRCIAGGLDHNGSHQQHIEQEEL